MYIYIYICVYIYIYIYVHITIIITLVIPRCDAARLSASRGEDDGAGVLLIICSMIYINDTHNGQYHFYDY